MQDVVHFHGTYRYATRENLELAIASARAVLADEDSDADAAWMRCFVTRGTVLTVNLTSRVDRFSAAAVLSLVPCWMPSTRACSMTRSSMSTSRDVPSTSTPMQRSTVDRIAFTRASVSGIGRF